MLSHNTYVVLGLYIDIPHVLSHVTYGINQVNTKMSTLGLIQEDLEGLNLQGMIKINY